MNKQKKLLIERGIFLFILFVSLGVIVVTEKANTFMIPKVDSKIKKYFDNNYIDIKETILFDNIEYKKSKFSMKISNTNNKYHYFYIYYQNKKITDTYKKDYLEGNHLLKHINKLLEKEILEKTKTNVKINNISKLNEYTSIVQDRIIKEDHLLELKFYTLEKEIIIDNWNVKEIVNSITETINKYTKNNITPKYYNLTITNKDNIKESILINQLTEDFTNNKEKELIIQDILNDNSKSKIIKKYKITYQYK